MNAIPKEKIQEILRMRSSMEISEISSALIESGYKHPEQPRNEEAGEHVNPFMADLEKCLATMAEEGQITRDTEGGKTRYSLNQLKASDKSC